VSIFRMFVAYYDWGIVPPRQWLLLTSSSRFAVVRRSSAHPKVDAIVMALRSQQIGFVLFLRHWCTAYTTNPYFSHWNL